MTGLGWDHLWVNVHLATMVPSAEPYGAIMDGALALTGDRIAWIGKRDDLPGGASRPAATVHDGGGRWMTPGLIDCHTHLVFGGERAREFELRLKGASYEEIARAGGGIVATVAATPAAGQDALLPEYAGRQGAYVDLVCAEMLPAVARSGLADAVDAFCETIGFTPDETARIFTAAAALGLKVKLHADQLSDLGGAGLAARFGALSADHLEYTSLDSVRAMAASGTVAVLLPGANYFLRERQMPPVAAFRDAGVPVAIASNCNPGSAPVLSLLLMLSMAATLFRLTPAGAVAGVTRNAARALGLDDRGVLAVGKRAGLALWDIAHPAELTYWIGHNPCSAVVQGGAPVE